MKRIRRNCALQNPRKLWLTVDQIEHLYHNRAIAEKMCKSKEAAGLARANPELPSDPEARQYYVGSSLRGERLLH
jgi:hypothetical protein